MRIPGIALDIALTVASARYALWLAEHKELEPADTYLEVMFGVGYTLALTRLYHESHPERTPNGVEWRIFQSFIVSCIPIVAGELAQKAKARAKLAAYRARRGG
jgi:hypothetical protein